MLPQITLDQVRVFLAVVDTGSFSQAGKRLKRAQSAVSYAIANLERLLEVELFDRQGRQTRLTPQGQTLLPSARNLVAQAALLIRDAEAIRNGSEPELRIAVDGLVPMRLVAQAMTAVRQAHPVATISLRSEALGAVPELLLHRRVDIGLSPLLQFHTKTLDCEAFTQVEMIPVAAPGAGPDTQPQIIIRDQTRLTDQMTFSVVKGPQCYVADVSTKHDLLLLGQGWGMLPRDLVQSDLQARRLVRLDGRQVPKPVTMQHYVGWRRDTDPGHVGRHFVRALFQTDGEARPHEPAIL